MSLKSRLLFRKLHDYLQSDKGGTVIEPATLTGTRNRDDKKRLDYQLSHLALLHSESNLPTTTANEFPGDTEF